jgi:hypothetical protein
MANGDDPYLIIEDDYFSDTGARCKSYGNHLNQQMSQYLSILDKICSEAIPSGAQHDALSAFAADVKILCGEHQNRLSSISDSLSTTCTNFIVQVDYDDQFLY